VVICHTAAKGLSLMVLAAIGAAAARGLDAPGPRGAGPAQWINDLTPIGPEDWSYDRAAHLLERAGFGGRPEEIARLASMTPKAAVAFLVDYEAIDNSHLPPFDESGIFDPAMEPFPESRAEAVRQGLERGQSMGVKVRPSGEYRLQPIVNRYFYRLSAARLEIRRAAQWWAGRMLNTRRPLEEKLCLFWHGHFATSDAKVNDYRKMLIQLETFRAHGAGNFRDLLLAVTRDPAMLVYLDNAQNRKGHPNENFGREVLEMFSMGPGHYTEDDIREAARAFTGWTEERLRFVVRPEEHDDGVKRLFGREGRFDGADVIDLILAQPATAEFIAAKFYRFFLRDELDPALQANLAETLRENGYEMKPLLRRLFLSRDFYSPASWATQIKGPVHLVVSTYRKLGLSEIPGIPDFNAATGALGQSLFHPPSVAGWEGGRSWLTPATLLERGNFTREVLLPDVDGFVPPDRRMPGIYRNVKERLNEGMDIRAATMEGDSAFNTLARTQEDYNTRYGAYYGWAEAFRRVRPIPRDVARFSLTEMVRGAKATTPAEAVEAFVRRFLLVPLDAEERQAIVEFLTERLRSAELDFADPYLEDALRETLHLILGSPHYQVG